MTSDPDCVFFLFLRAYARARACHITQQDFTIELVDRLYEHGRLLHPPGVYFMVMGNTMDLHVHSAIQNRDAMEVILVHQQDERMNGMSKQKYVVVLVCSKGGGAPIPIRTDDVDIFVQSIAK